MAIWAPVESAVDAAGILGVVISLLSAAVVVTLGFRAFDTIKATLVRLNRP